MSYFFEARYFRADGRSEKRDFFLPSIGQVRSEITASGATVISIVKRHHSVWQKEWYSRDYKINFLKAIAMQARSGKSPGQALATVIGNERNPRKRIELDKALQMIDRQGRDFSDAIAQMGILDRTAITILRAGERSGMKRAVDATIQYLSEKKAGVKQLVAGLGWVSFEFLMAVVSTFEVQVQVLPWLEEQVAKAPHGPDSATFARDMHIAYWCNGLFLWGAVALVASLAGLVVAYNVNPAIRERVDRKLLSIPVLNRFFVDGVMGQSFHIAGIMLASRVTFYDVAATLAEVSAVPLVKRYWTGVLKALRSTSTTSDALIAGGMLHREEQQFLRHHEDAFQLSESFALLADNRAESFARGRKALIMIGFITMVVYSMVSICVVLFLYSIYSSTLNASLMDYAGAGS